MGPHIKRTQKFEALHILGATATDHTHSRTMHQISAMMRWLRLGGIYRSDGEWLVSLILKRTICMLFMLEAIVPMVRTESIVNVH